MTPLDPARRWPFRLPRGRRAATPALLALMVAACRPPAPPPPAPAATSEARGPFFYKGRDYGSDAYAGPLDVLANKGFAIAQWEGHGRNVFSYKYGWNAVKLSLQHPVALIRRDGGWAEVMRRQAVPFAEGGLKDAQWMPNYFGHVLEGGIGYRRMREWNEAHGVVLPSLTAGLVTYAAALVNEAYELPVGEPGSEGGTAGTVVDLYIFDPLGILLFHQDFAARFVSGPLRGALWPTQASLIVTDGTLLNNGESVVIKPPMPFTDRARFFLRMGVGAEAGISVRRGDGTDVSFAVGGQSRERWLNPFTRIEYAAFGWSASAWLDRDGVLLAGLTWDQATDRRIALNVYPGFARVLGAGVGAWFVLDASGRPYLGFSTSRTLGAGLGVGF